jgi:hypothetical protein
MLASLWRAAVCGFAVSVLENVIWRPFAWRSNDSVARMCFVEAALLIF